MGLVEDDGAGDGGVKALDGTGAGDGDAGVGEFKPLGGETGALSLPMRMATARVRSTSAISKISSVPDAFTDGGEDLNAAAFECEDLGEAGGDDRRAEEGADAGADCLSVPWTAGAGRGDEAVGAKGFGGANQSARGCRGPGD